MHQEPDHEDAALDVYRVVVDGPEVELRVKASRFFGRALSARDPEAAARRLDAIRKQYHDASHHCWALRCGDPGAVFERSDDDGEPSGTAGPPLLHPLRASGLHDGLVVVTRWFGGTKLGKGGLVQAYGECAQRALAAAGAREIWREIELGVVVRYDDIGHVEALIAREAAMVRGVERNFGATPHFTIRVRRSQAERIAALLVESTAGRAQLEQRAL